MNKQKFTNLLSNAMELLVDGRVYKIKIPLEQQEVCYITDKYITYNRKVYWKNPIKKTSRKLDVLYDDIYFEDWYNSFCFCLQLLHDTIKNEGIYLSKRVYGEKLN